MNKILIFDDKINFYFLKMFLYMTSVVYFRTFLCRRPQHCILSSTTLHSQSLPLNECFGNMLLFCFLLKHLGGGCKLSDAKHSWIKVIYHSCMLNPLGTDPIRVQLMVCCLFWTNRNSMAAKTIFLSISLSN